MSVEDPQNAVQRFRTVELRGAIRGVDAEQARALLNEAADSLEAVVRKQNELRRELERVRAANDQEAIGGALLVATRTGERIVAEARQRAAAIIAEADAQASAVLEQIAAQTQKREQETVAAHEQFKRELTARRSTHAAEHESALAENNTALADARRELARLENDAERVRSLVTDTRRRAAQIIERALEELESPKAAGGGEEAEGGMLRALRPTTAPSEIAAD
jgi:cell division septum initiation protein DivIVA